jgi:ABC-type polysaccharide/polyol phosphate export permease
MTYIITALVCLALGFIAGALVYRKNQARIESVKDAATK